MADRIITIADIRRTGHCTRGARRWFEANGLDFGAFLRDGLPAETLLSTGDSLAERVVGSVTERSDG